MGNPKTRFVKSLITNINMLFIIALASVFTVAQSCVNVLDPAMAATIDYDKLKQGLGPALCIPTASGAANGDVTFDELSPGQIIATSMNGYIFLPAKYAKDSDMEQLSCAMPSEYISGLLANPPTLDFSTVELTCVGDDDNTTYFALKNGIIAAQDGTSDGYLLKPTVAANGTVVLQDYTPVTQQEKCDAPSLSSTPNPDCATTTSSGTATPASSSTTGGPATSGTSGSTASGPASSTTAGNNAPGTAASNPAPASTSAPAPATSETLPSAPETTQDADSLKKPNSANTLYIASSIVVLALTFSF